MHNELQHQEWHLKMILFFTLLCLYLLICREITAFQSLHTVKGISHTMIVFVNRFCYAQNELYLTHTYQDQ